MATQSQLAALRGRIGATLRSTGINKINFTYDGVTINSSDYFRIARAVIADKVHVKVVRLEPGVGAQYDPRSNTLEFPSIQYGTKPSEQVTITHEATHAILDMNKVKITALKNEITAYIAGGIFQIYNDSKAIPKSTSRRIGAEIAKDILYNGKKILTTGSLGIGLLATAIINDPIYDFIHANERLEFTQDGIPGA